MSDAAQVHPNYADQAMSLYHLGRYQDSLTAVDNAMSRASNNATLWFLKAINLSALKEHQQAVPILEALSESIPDNFDIHFHLCQALFESGRINRSIEFAKQGVAGHENDLRYYDILINLLFASLRSYEAQQVCLAAIRLDSKNPERWVKLAECYHQDQDMAKAAAALAEVRALVPEGRRVLFTYAELVQQLGGKSEAIKIYRSLLRKRFDGEVFSGLAHATKIDPDGMLVRKAKSAINEKGISSENKSNLKFGLAKVYDRAGEYLRAAEYYVSANALRAEKLKFDRDSHGSMLKEIKASFSEGYCAGDHSGVDTRAPIFIVGMPRSGSTLLEQVLSSHSNVDGAGEATALRRLTLNTDPTPFARNYVEYTHEERSAFAQNYLKLISTHCVFQNRFTDKNLYNWENIGYILSSMPNAKILHSRRDERAGNLSIFKLPYGANMPFSASVSDLKWYRAQYEEMMAFWEERFPGRILHVDYEDTVLDLEGQARRVLAYLDLPWEDQVLSFHENERAAVTASYDQVRQKLYQSSLEPWRKYQGTKLAEALGF